MLSRNSIRAVVAAMAIVFSAALNNNALAVFVDGDLVTYWQAGWDDHPTAVNLLHNYYDSVYESSFSLVEVGIPGPGGFSMFFSAAISVIGYLPASGTLAPLNTDHLDPTRTESGAFGGEVLALRLNIDFSDAGVTLGNLGIPFGDLQLRNLPLSSNLNDLTVRQFIGHANHLLGGGSSLFYSIDQLVHVTALLNSSFGAGGVSIFAQDHLRVVGGFPADFDEDGDVDSADLAHWKGGFGTVGTATHLQGDADGDQDSDGRDFLLWQRQLGRTPGGGAALAAVPEPATTGLALAMFGVTSLICGRRPNKIRIASCEMEEASGQW